MIGIALVTGASRGIGRAVARRLAGEGYSVCINYRERRDRAEELAAEITVTEYLTSIEYDYPAFHLSMQCYLAKITHGTPVLLEHEAARWLTPEELDTVAWLPADQTIIALLKDKLR